MKIEKINWVFPIVMVQRKSDEGRSTGPERHEDERERRVEFWGLYGRRARREDATYANLEVYNCFCV